MRFVITARVVVLSESATDIDDIQTQLERHLEEFEPDTEGYEDDSPVLTVGECEVLED